MKVSISIHHLLKQNRMSFRIMTICCIGIMFDFLRMNFSQEFITSGRLSVVRLSVMIVALLDPHMDGRLRIRPNDLRSEVPSKHFGHI